MQERDAKGIRGDQLAETDPAPEREGVRPDGVRGDELAETGEMRQRDVDPDGPRGEGLAEDA
jgi:hypothetical protein